MRDTTRQLLDRAVDAIEAADILLTNNNAAIAAGRAYYAMFYTAEALLNEKDIQFGKHGNVIGAYGQHFAKTKELGPKFHRWLLTSFDQRQIGDYAFDPNVENDVVSSNDPSGAGVFGSRKEISRRRIEGTPCIINNEEG